MTPDRIDYDQLSKNVLSMPNTYDLSTEGVVAKNNSDKTFLTVNDAANDIHFTLMLFSSYYKEKYTIIESYNISELNMNYKLFDRLKKQVVDTALLTYVDKKETE